MDGTSPPVSHDCLEHRESYHLNQYLLAHLLHENGQKAFSLRGFGPLTPTRGSAPEPHWRLHPHIPVLDMACPLWQILDLLWATSNEKLMHISLFIILSQLPLLQQYYTVSKKIRSHYNFCFMFHARPSAT